MTDKNISVVIADDNACFVDLLGTYINKQKGLCVAGTAFDGAEAYRVICDKKPDVVLLDIVMPKLNGLDVIRRINKEGFGLKPNIIILSALGQEKVTEEALSLGIVYYMIKPFDFETVVSRIKMLCDYDGPENTEGGYPPQTHLFGYRDMDTENKINGLLLKMGIPPDIQGFQFIKDFIWIMHRDYKYEEPMPKYIYSVIAGHYKTTPVCVERAIRYAKTLAYKNISCNLTNPDGFTAEKRMPTNLEWIKAFPEI